MGSQAARRQSRFQHATSDELQVGRVVSTGARSRVRLRSFRCGLLQVAKRAKEKEDEKSERNGVKSGQEGGDVKGNAEEGDDEKGFEREERDKMRSGSAPWTKTRAARTGW